MANAAVGSGFSAGESPVGSETEGAAGVLGLRGSPEEVMISVACDVVASVIDSVTDEYLY